MKDDSAASMPVDGPKGDGQRFAPGTLVAKRYRLDRLIGEGGMGVVWAATHTVTLRPVAMKFLRGEALRKNLGFRQRFLREARAASAVQHPNVVTISDVFELDDETPVMVMDLLVGETLGQKLARESKLTLEQTAATLLPVVSAVGTAHALGIVHRDLKPDNIFLVEGAPPGGAVRVLDFGIAKVLEADPEAESAPVITETGAILGTPCYMSPEQALGEQDIDHRSDIWSLGVILYECLTGSRPIRGESIGQIVKQIVVDGVRPIDELEADLPPALIHMVGRMLTRERSRRPPDLNRIVELLGAYTRVEVPSFGPPELSGRLPEADDERETRVDRKSRPRAREAPKVDTEGPQSVPTGVQQRPRRSMLTLAAGMGLVVVGIFVWQSRAHEIKPGKNDDVQPAATANVTITSAPSPAPASSQPTAEPAAEPRPATTSKEPSSERVRPVVPLASKSSARPAHPSPPSSGARPAASSDVSLAAPSAAPPNRPFSGGLSEKVPF